MIELPEAVNLTKQLNTTVSGKRIVKVTVGQTTHKLAWYYGDKTKYAELLNGKTVGKTTAYGGLVEIHAEKACILFGDGVNLRFHNSKEPHPSKHQMLIEFNDGCALSAVIQMYGGVGSYHEGELENAYYRIAKEKPSPLTAEFDEDYFDRLISAPETQRLSIKGMLATEQRIPGLGNGVLQDILFQAKIHPKKKVETLAKQDKVLLYNSVKEILSAMADGGGRDTESDMFGKPGGYRTILSKNTVGKPCPVCGAAINKEAYMGGSIYYCENCQKK